MNLPYFFVYAWIIARSYTLPKPVLHGIAVGQQACTATAARRSGRRLSSYKRRCRQRHSEIRQGAKDVNSRSSERIYGRTGERRYRRRDCKIMEYCGIIPINAGVYLGRVIGACADHGLRNRTLVTPRLRPLPRIPHFRHGRRNARGDRPSA